MIFSNQMDYIFFIYGFSFILLGFILLIFAKTERTGIKYNGLTVFAFVHGLNEWLDMLALVFGDSDKLKLARVFVNLISFVALMQFARQNLFKKIPWYVTLLFPLLALSGLFIDANVFNIFTRYFVGFPAALLSAYFFYKNREAPFFKFIAFFMFTYSLTSGIVVPTGPFFPANIINQQSFLEILAFPIQLLRGFSAAMVAMGVYLYFQYLNKGHLTHWLSSGLSLCISMSVILGFGWLATHEYGHFSEEEAKSHFLKTSIYASSMIDVEHIKAYSGLEKDTKNDSWQFINNSFKRLRKQIKELRFCYLIKLKDQKIIFLLDSEDMSSKDYSPPGSIYNDPPDGLREAYQEKKNLLIGPYTDQWGHFVSTFIPLIDPKTDEMIAMLGFDINAIQFYPTINQKRFIVIMVIFIFSTVWLMSWTLIRNILVHTHEKGKIQAQLLHSAKLASIGTLASGVAHEINNPLAIIAGYAQIMEKSCKDLCQKGNPEKIKQILNAAERASNIVKNLNNFSRQDTNNIDRVDIHSCIREVLSLVKNIFEKENLKLESHLEAEHFIVKANAGKMSQVLMNILSNAKDALKGKLNATVTISTQNTNEGLLVIISDNGQGIPPKIIKKIFDPFFTTKEPGKGTGLGLSISHTIIQSFGGTIHAKSELGIGTRFEILLPKS